MGESKRRTSRGALLEKRLCVAANEIGQTVGIMVTALLAVPPKLDGTPADTEATLRALFAAQSALHSAVSRECAEGFTTSIRFALAD